MIYTCFKEPAWRSESYLAYIRKQPPLIEGQGQTVPHHVRIDNNAGAGLKPSDWYCVPLPVLVHNKFHGGTESDREFWLRHKIDIYKEIFELYTKWSRENETTRL